VIECVAGITLQTPRKIGTGIAQEIGETDQKRGGSKLE
jgi:hypothetical protein